MLDSVLKYRRHRLAEAQAALAELLQADSRLAAMQEERRTSRAGVAAEVAERSAGGRLDVAALSSRLLYAGQMQAAAAGLQQRRDTLAAPIDEARAAVAAADADVQAIEKLQEKRAAAARRQAMRREQITLEEAHAARRSHD